MTLAELRNRIREEIGDEQRITGTISSGSTTSIVSSSLNQADNTWKGYRLNITDTTDDAAPEGESGRIVSSSQSATSVTLELPLTAAVENGDTFGISLFSDSRLNNIISDSFAEFSEFRPREFTENYVVAENQKRIAPTSANVQGFRPDKIEFFSSTNREQTEYNVDGRQDWRWDTHLRTIEWSWWWSETKTLTLYGTKHHLIPDNDGDDITILAEDIHNFIRFASINSLLSMSERELFDDFGKLSPKSWTRGRVKIDTGDQSSTFKGLRENWTNEKGIVKAKYMMPLSFDIDNIPSDRKVNVHADPDGTPMPQVFWEIN